MKNLKVSLKLAIGFAAVVLLLVVVAIMGISSLNGLVARGEKVLLVDNLLQ